MYYIRVMRNRPNRLLLAISLVVMMGIVFAIPASADDAVDDKKLPVEQVQEEEEKAPAADTEEGKLLSKQGTEYGLEVAANLSDGVILTAADGSYVKMTRLTDGDADDVGTLVGDDVVTYENQKSIVMALETGGYAFLEIILSNESPASFSYRIELEESQSLVSDGEGGYLVVNKDGLTIVSLSAPSAHDWEGEEVPTRFVLDGDVLTMEVDHTSGDYAYPIIADPCWKCIASSVTHGIVVGGISMAVGGCVIGLVFGPAGCLAGATIGAWSGIIGGGTAGAIVAVLPPPVTPVPAPVPTPAPTPTPPPERIPPSGLADKGD